MPFLKINIHFVWSTKNRYPFLDSFEKRQTVFNHVKDNAKKNGIWLDRVNGHSDHIHCINSLGSEQTISRVLQMIKGESSYWINKNNICKSKFEWQDEYYGVSVSPEELDRVRAYIDNQEFHHAKINFEDELKQLLKDYGFEKNLLR